MSNEKVIKAAEVALGLRADDSRDDAELAALVQFWEEQLAALNGTDVLSPPDDLWDRIDARIDMGDSAPGTRSVTAAEGIWERLAPGIERKVVHVNRNEGSQCFFVRMKQGAVLPSHAHHLDEHCVVLTGRLRVGTGEFGPGTYHFAKSQSDHVEIVAIEAVEFFIYGALEQTASNTSIN